MSVTCLNLETPVANDFAASVSRSADAMMRTYGNEAEASARHTATRMAGRKDVYGERFWLAIAEVIRKQQQGRQR